MMNVVEGSLKDLVKISSIGMRFKRALRDGVFFKTLTIETKYTLSGARCHKIWFELFPLIFFCMLLYTIL